MGWLGGKKKAQEEAQKFPFQLSEAEWKERLTSEQFRILRKDGTERAYSSPLNDEKRDGSYHCTGCDNFLFLSAHKFDSHTGWPSFWQPATADKSIETSIDRRLFYPRTEEHCANCGSHLGHIFDDGPQPTGKRHCINGVAMVFKSAKS